MVLRVYLFGLYLTLFLSCGLFFLILFNVNPYTSPTWMITLFYVTFFLIWMAFLGLIGFYTKVWATNREVIFAHLVPTLRQAAIVSLFITGLLFLYQIKVLSWWISLLLIVAFIMIELYFRKK